MKKKLTKSIYFKGHRKAETQRKLSYDPKKGFVLVEEALLMKASLFLNNKNNKYQDKMVRNLLIFLHIYSFLGSFLYKSLIRKIK